MIGLTLWWDQNAAVSDHQNLWSSGIFWPVCWFVCTGHDLSRGQGSAEVRGQTCRRFYTSPLVSCSSPHLSYS